ncbi:MAG: hypothetical protein ACU84Q_03440 [Gammaproteobacteria bacterium]
MSDNPSLPRKAKGERPFFFDNPDVDKLLAMLMGLAGEVSVMRDRMDTIEQLATERGLFSAADIEAYEPNPEVMQQRAARRQEMLGEITRIVYSEIEGLEATDETGYQTAVADVEQDG